MTITITKLRHLVAVNNCGSFSKAAIREHVSQPAISRSISEIESALDQPVFHRTSTGVLATDVGQEFVSRAARLLADMDALFNDLMDQGNAYRERLRIAFAPAAVEGLIGHSVFNFAKKYPNIMLDLLPSPTQDVGLVLLRGDADIAIGVRSLLTGWADLSVFPFARHRFVFFVRKGHPLSRQKQVRETDLTKFPMVLPPHAEHYSSLLEKVSGQLQISTMNHFPTIQNIVQATDAISIVFDKYTSSHIFVSRFCTIPSINLGMDGDLYYAYIARRPTKPAARAFVDLASNCG